MVCTDFEDHVIKIGGCPEFFATNLNGYYQISSTKPVVNGRLHFENKERGLHLYWHEPKWRIGMENGED